MSRGEAWLVLGLLGVILAGLLAMPKVPRSGRDRGPGVWTVYWSPVDYPRQWVARRFVVELVGGKLEPTATTDMFVADSISELRALLPAGLRRVPRLTTDSTSIVETWV